MNKPPRLPLRFFRWFCHSKLRDHIEGDLMELYEERIKEIGKRKADLKFTIDVILLFRKGIIRPTEGYKNLNNYGVYKNYFTTSWRTIINGKFYSAINLLGLTLGFTIGLLILLWVNDELHFDSFNRKAAQIYRMSVNLESSGNKFAVQVVQPPIAYFGLKEVPGIRQAVRVTDCNDYSVLTYQGKAMANNLIVYTDASLFKIFDYSLLQGDIKNPLPNAESMIITQTAAKRFFGDSDPMGKIIIADNKDNFVITGVMADFPENSWLKCDVLLSNELAARKYKERWNASLDEEAWGNYGWVTFLELQPGVLIKNIEEQLTKINVSHQPTLTPTDVGYYTLQPLLDIHLYGPDGSEAGIQTVRIFLVVAILILLIASINYVNLSTARALLRFKEVSIRKIIGATRMQLFIQFVIQTCLFFFIAWIISMAAITLVMPLYNGISGKHMQFDLFNPMIWQVMGITLLVTLIVSSIYPALLLSSFHPIQALKQKLTWGMGNAAFRKVLVVCQFTFSIGLIIATLIIGKQLNYVLQAELGYDKSFVFSVNMNNMEKHSDQVKAELMAQTSIKGVTSATNNIVNVAGSTLDVDWDGKNKDESFFVHTAGVDKDFISLFHIPMSYGNNFTGDQSDSLHFVLNETALRKSGIQDPIGKRFRLHGREGTIIGVVKDFHFVSLRQKIEPFIFYFEPSGSTLFVKANGRDAKEAVGSVEKLWKKYNEGFPFDYTFLDDTYRKHYESEQRIGKLFSIFTGVAIVISCLGLLGLATYTAHRKVKEIGIRKVLGASVANIAYMLSKNFLLLVIVSFVIAAPLAWILMKKWIQNFAYQTDIQWWIIALAGLAAIAIALFTISFQAIRSALENPVKSLKTE